MLALGLLVTWLGGVAIGHWLNDFARARALKTDSAALLALLNQGRDGEA